MAFCVKCGTQLTDGANFCASCGTSAEGTVSEPKLETKKESVFDKLPVKNTAKAKEKLNAVKEKVNTGIKRLPFKKLAEDKIPAGARAKFPLLEKAIPLTNLIVCGLAVALVVTVIAVSGGGGGGSFGGGRPTPASDFGYALTEDGKGIKITAYNGKHKRIIVPSKIEGHPVVEIGDYVFIGAEPSELGVKYNGAHYAEYIYIPDSVTKIGYGIFSTTLNLREVRLSDNITIIPGSAFSNEHPTQTPKLVKVNLPKSLQEIESIAFRGQVNLSKLVIPASLKDVKFSESHPRHGAESQNKIILRTIIQDSWSSEDDVVSILEPNNLSFEGCGKLPLATRAKIQSWGYEGSF